MLLSIVLGQNFLLAVFVKIAVKVEEKNLFG